MGRSAHCNKKAIDASVGRLVWVRRQNGSWWPGRILSPDELPETILPVPRAGTPIQLLGREDTSLDWYNLETSKRVKSFRCGEHDSCIQKAKASTSNSSKKTAGRYARRDNAIIHALEIESACEAFDKDSSSSEDYSDSAEKPLASDVAIEELHHLGPSSGMIWLPLYYSISSKRRRKSRSRKPDGYVYKSDTILDSLFGKSGPITDVKVEKSSVHLMKPHETRGKADEVAVPQRLMPHRQSRSIVNPKYDLSNFYLGDCIDDCGLYDVTLKPNMSYQAQHVPNISLTSKLTYKSIVGHPLNVDVSEAGMVIEKRPRGRPRTKNVMPQQLVPPVKSRKSKKHRGLSRKTRKFASLTGLPEPEEIPVINMLANPVVACIPLRVVFSQLNAALNSSI
ncbi:unnamed protein product [Fraxinus pennsylvanica]|uniref:PWWP domain-containing protein n=1 Tax=Fraxinus pennsylvanica TaxID=56036 RepID=A0AAD1ZDQ6_9LAMI|nr:unnamed protein product [Fraxinus pennsylvanica]